MTVKRQEVEADSEAVVSANAFAALLAAITRHI